MAIKDKASAERLLTLTGKIQYRKQRTYIAGEKLADLSVKDLETRFCILTYQLVLYAERDVNGSVLWQGIISLCPSLIFFFK